MVCDYSAYWYYEYNSFNYYSYCNSQGLDGYNNYYAKCCDVQTWRLWYSFMWIGIFLCFMILCIAMAKARARKRQAYMNNM